MTEAESELASVMAHEIAHITQRHLFRAAEAAGRYQFLQSRQLWRLFY